LHLLKIGQQSFWGDTYIPIDQNYKIHDLCCLYDSLKIQIKARNY